jgi:hypothetical protein
MSKVSALLKIDDRILYGVPITTRFMKDHDASRTLSSLHSFLVRMFDRWSVEVSIGLQ